MPDTLLEYVRSQIKLIRKSKKISMEELGKKINKDKTTVSKYESGKIELELRILMDIAEALDVSLFQLLGSDALSVGKKSTERRTPRSVNYFLYRGVQNNAFCRSWITSQCLPDSENSDVFMFHNIPSFSQIDKCEFLYKGTMKESDLYLSFHLENQTNFMENLFIIVRKTLKKSGVLVGILAGIAYPHYLPAITKVVLSDNELEDGDPMFQIMWFSKNEVDILRKTNTLATS
jgi:transcriptional regulator with XRE-family HTH domain